MQTKKLALRHWQRTASTLLLAGYMSFFPIVMASPGAHGPNGEHLDTAEKVQVSTNPRFESFTETFELVGELLDAQFVIYLHEFKTNHPVDEASIELELGELRASATYSEQLRAYQITNEALIAQLAQPGNHELVVTILTADAGDLLVANLVNTAIADDQAYLVARHDETVDEHLPWWVIAGGLVIFIVGVTIGRQLQERSK